jgi:ribosomal protein RSM22 (predicted rRNA methylase)
MPSGDWCHAAARVERTALHRKLKDGRLSYEDEKFSYLAVARTPVTRPTARVIARPEHSPGLIQLRLCHHGQIETARITKRNKPQFRQARQEQSES